MSKYFKTFGQYKFSLFACYFILFSLATITLLGGKWKKHSVIKSDAAGYYVYLPALFIYNDIFQCDFYPEIDSIYNPGDGVVYYAVHYSHETGHKYFKYTYGVTAFQLPAFFIAHIITKLTGNFSADGYSVYYQLAVALNSVLFAFLALLILRKFLLYYFTDIVVTIVLIVLAIGTNFFAQVITQPGLSHIYLFFLYSVVLLFSYRWHHNHYFKDGLILALAIGMCIIARPTDIFIVFFPLLWTFSFKSDFDSFLRYWKQYLFQLAGMFCVILIIAGVQFVYWKAATAHWIFYTYKNEYFDFSNWQIINGLFSFRKGWFVYTPAALLGFAGIFVALKNDRFKFYLLPFALYFVATLWVVFSWWQWYYGGSFGCRVLIQSLTLLALPMGLLIERMLKAGVFLKISFFTLILLLIGLNIFQTAQYAKGIIHWQKMNREYYFKVFGKWNISEKDKQLLNQTEELTTGIKQR